MLIVFPLNFLGVLALTFYNGLLLVQVVPMLSNYLF